MKLLIPVLFSLLAAPRAFSEQPDQGCPDPAAWEFIKRSYPSPDKPDPAAFLKLDSQTRQRLCEAALSASQGNGGAAAPPQDAGVGSSLSNTGKKVDDINRKKDPFGPANQPELMPGGFPQGVPAGGGAGRKTSTAPQGGLRAGDFKPQQKFKPPVVPAKAPAPQPEQKILSIQDGSRELIERFGDPREALWQVITARGGDDGEVVSPADRRKAWREINMVVGGLKDPDSLKKGETDERLRDFDHFLNAFGGVHGEGILRPDEEDGFVKGRAKILGRTAVGVGATVITTGYTAVKWFDQTFGTSVGKLAGYDFNTEKTSKSSWNEMWQGLKGAWYGVYTTDYGARAAKRK